MTPMGRRGETLRDHILWTAKDVFLEHGFERASMDAVAARAETSKRTLYAHFENKDKLFHAVLDMTRVLFLSKLVSPATFSAKPAEAMTQFCARYLDMVTYDGWVRMCRISISERDRFPQAAEELFDLLFSRVEATLAAYLRSELGVSSRASGVEAERLLGQTLYPRFQRVLFGVDVPAKTFDPARLSPGFDLKPIRRAVQDLLDRIVT